MSLAIPDRLLWLGIGAGIYALVRAVSYGLHDVYNLTEVAPEPDSPRAVAQGTEDDIPLPSLQVLATQHPNLEIRKAATAIVTTRVLNDPATIRRILSDYKKPEGAPDQRAARNAIQLIRSTNGVDLEDWDEDQKADEDDVVVLSIAEVGFDATGQITGGTGRRTRSTADMRREMASRYWAVEHVREGEDWDEESDINSQAGSADTSDDERDADDAENEDQDLTITVNGGHLVADGSLIEALPLPRSARRNTTTDHGVARHGQRELDSDVAAFLADLNRPPEPPNDELISTYGNASTTSAGHDNGGSEQIVTVWDHRRFPESRRAHGLRDSRRRGGEDGTTAGGSTSRPHPRRLRARSSRESEEEVARRRVRREAVVVNDGDRPISQEDIIQRPIQRRSY